MMSNAEKRQRAESALRLIKSGRWFTCGDVGERLGLKVRAGYLRRIAGIMGRLVLAGKLEREKPWSNAIAGSCYRWKGDA